MAKKERSPYTEQLTVRVEPEMQQLAGEVSKRSGLSVNQLFADGLRLVLRKTNPDVIERVEWAGNWADSISKKQG